MNRKISFGYDWSVSFILLMLAVFTVSFMPKEKVDWSIRRIAGAVAWLGSAPPNTINRPDVLVVSKQAGDQFAVTSTLEPRGYAIHMAGGADAALAELRKLGNRIGMVVVDEALPDSRKTLAAARNLAPGAFPILLKGRREPAQVARILMDTMGRITPVQARGLRQEATLHEVPER